MTAPDPAPRPAPSAEARRLSRDEFAFLRELPSDCRNAKAHPRTSGSTMKARLKRWGYARYDNSARNTGWVLTFAGREVRDAHAAALAQLAAEP